MKLQSLLCCLLLTIGANSYNTAKAQAINVNDSLALVDFYNSTNGPGWVYNTNWLTSSPVKTWAGIYVTGTRVTQINLTFNGLSGPLPASFGNLDMLTYLTFNSNALSGEIPSSFGNLTHLVNADFFNNRLTGSIPASIGNLVSLESIDLRLNQLSGSLPSAIGNLISLQNLKLSDNQFSGPIPATIGNLTNLLDLECFNSYLTDTIPASIGNLKKLQHLSFDNNDLSGVIPSSVKNLANLQSLGLSGNRLSGHIPAYIGDFENLIYLFLDNNQFTGTIPASFNKLNTIYLFLNNNQLSQSRNIAPPMSQARNTILDVSYNRFTFNSLEWMAQKRPYVVYAPQALISIHKNGNVLSTSAGGTLSNNTYKWYKKGAAGSTIITGDSTFHPVQSGRYYVEVTNAIATKLTLTTDTVNYTMPLLESETFSIAALTTQGNSLVNHFIFYPNPAKNSVQIKVAGAAIITLRNSDGKVLLTKNITNSQAINVSAYANGTYYLQNNTTGEVQKVAIVH